MLVAVTGEAGIGKTHLVEEFSRRVCSDGRARSYAGYARPYRDDSGYSALSQIIKAAAGILDSDSGAEAGEKLQRAVSKAVDDAEAEWLTRHLELLVGLGKKTSALSPGRPETFAAWRAFLKGLARDRPHVLILEDVHRAEDGVLQFVRSFVEWISDAPLLIVVTARPPLSDPSYDFCAGIENGTTLQLRPLSARDVGVILDQIADEHPLPETLRSEVLTKASGNPLFAEQYARLIRERPQDVAVDVPDAVRMIVAARIDALPTAERGLLRSAAVFSEVFWTGAAAAVEGTYHRSAEVHLKALERKQLIQRRSASSVAGEGEFAFTHALVREVANSQLTRTARAERHERAAQWIDTLGRSEDHVEALAQHYECALALRLEHEGREQLIPRTREALVKAADRAAMLHAYDRAAAQYRRAVDLTSSDDVRRPQLLLQLARATYFSGDDAAQSALEDAQDALIAADARGAAAEASAFLAELAWHHGRRDLVDQWVRQAVDLLDEGAAPEVRGRVLEAVARSQGKTGDHAAAIRSARDARLAVESLDAPELLAEILITLGISRWQARDPRGVIDIERGLDLAIRSNALTAAPRGYSNLAHVLAQRGDSKGSMELLLQSKRVAERLGERRTLRRTKANILVAEYARGNWDNAMRLATEFIDECEAGSPHVAEIQARAVRASIWLGRGEAEAAVAEDELALELARPAGTEPTRWQLSVIAFVYAELGQLERARAYADEVLSLGHGERAFWAGQVLMLGLVAHQLEIVDPMQTLLGPEEIDWFEERVLRAVLAGDCVRAADMMSQFGKRTMEALLRIRAGRLLHNSERYVAAAQQLEQALRFFRSVAATYYIDQIELELSALATRGDVLQAPAGRLTSNR